MLRASVIPIVFSAAYLSTADDMRSCTEGDTDTTISSCTKVITQNPPQAFTVVALANRAVAQQRKGDVDKAKSDINEAIKMDPEWGYLYRVRGGLYARQGTFGKAREDLDKSISLDATDAATLYLSCQVWFEMADYDKAIKDCSSTIDLDPHIAKGYVFRGQSHWFQGQYGKAVDDLLKAVLLDQSNAQVYAVLGDSFLQIGNRDRALEALDNAIALEPTILIARYERGKIFQAKGENEKAISDYRAALALPVSDDYGRKLQGDALESLTAMQGRTAPAPDTSKNDAARAPNDSTRPKQSMCEFADASLRKRMGCE